MKHITRRNFIEKSMAVGAAGVVAPSMLSSVLPEPASKMIKDDISLAQWALVNEIRSGKWKTLDFPSVARKDFGLNGIELVNLLFEVPIEGYLKQLKKNAEDNNVTMVEIMCSEEGDGCSVTKEERRQFVINHRKWIDIAQYLGCTAIRTDCRGPKDVNKDEALKYSVEAYNLLLEYAIPAKISILIENHGGISNDAEWMTALMKEVNCLYFGTLPDWREPSDDFDNVDYLAKMLPFAGGMSYRNQPTEEQTAKMIKMCKDAGYRGWYGIESDGREAINKGIGWLKKYLI